MESSMGQKLPPDHSTVNWQDTKRLICFRRGTMQEGVLSNIHQCIRETSYPPAIGQAGEGDSDMANSIIDLFAINPHAAFHINSVINSYTVHFMLDIGAAVSLLNTDTWNKVRGTSTLVPWTNPGLVGVSGTPLRVSGKAKLQLKLGEQLYPVEVVVADLRTEGILGLDFLETNRCAIDLVNGSMRLNGSDQLIPLYRTGETKRQMENVAMSQVHE